MLSVGRVRVRGVQALAAEAKEALQGSSVYLVGMMGSGKSTVGKLVGKALGYCSFDTDSLIEQMAGGRSVAQIFAEEGEESFRAMETRVLQARSSPGLFSDGVADAWRALGICRWPWAGK